MAGKKRRGRGEGSYRQLPSGLWQAALPGRARAGRTKTFPTKQEAIDWLREHGSRKAAAAGTLGGWLDTWLTLHQSRIAVHSFQSDRSLVNKHIRPALGGVRLRDLDALRIETFLAGLKGRPGISIDLRWRIAKTLRNALNAATRTGGLFTVSPMAHVKMPPMAKPVTRAFTADELRAVLTAATLLGRGLMFRVWLELGLRPGELIGLRWGDLVNGSVLVVRTIDSATNEEKPPKTPREAPVPLSSELAAELEAVRDAPHLPMFPSRRGNGHWWKTNFLQFVWRPVMRKAGVNPGPSGRYIVRHTTASVLLSAGVSVVAVSKRLGHSTPAFTLRKYAHLMKGDQERATAVIGSVLAELRGGSPAS